MSKGKITDLSNSSFLNRVGQRARNTIAGVASAWFGPLDPLVPMAPPDVIGRAFDYPVGYNINTQPRPLEPGMFADLRNLAQNCDVLRMVIETRKDQLEALPWVIAPRVGEEKRSDNDAKIKEISTFFEYPDKEHDWSQWLRIIMEDVFVLDAAALYKRPNKKGGLYALETIDGATIARKIDASGRRPMFPDPAYQQILKGIPASDYTTNELIYLQRNPRSWTPYGLGPVEQIILTVNTQIRRMLEQLAYFTAGNIPLGFGTLPKDYTPQQIIDFQKGFNAMREGNQEQRSQMVFMPSEFKYQAAKEAPLKSDFDEWLARKICFAFSISADPFIHQVNRATADISKEKASEEGLVPTQHFLKRIMDKIIREDFEAPHLEFIWQSDKESDAKEAADINVAYVKSGIRSIDQIRMELGDEPLGGAYAIPSLATGSGYVAVGEKLGGSVNDEETVDEDGDISNPSNKDDKDNIDDEVEAKKLAYARLAKRGKRKPIPFHRAATKKGNAALKKKMVTILDKTNKEVCAEIGRKITKRFVKDAVEDNANKAKKISDSLSLDSLTEVAYLVPSTLAEIAEDSAFYVLAQIGVKEDSKIVDRVFDRAVTYAKDRAAEMVGKKWVDGELVDNPNAKWVITDTTREEIKTIITNGLNDNIGKQAIIKNIQEATAFSKERADMIASTEIGTANSKGALEGYREARDLGVKLKKTWIPDDDPCPECEENSKAGPIDLEGLFPSGDECPLAHPGCECVLSAVVEEYEEENLEE